MTEERERENVGRKNRYNIANLLKYFVSLCVKYGTHALNSQKKAGSIRLSRERARAGSISVRRNRIRICEQKGKREKEKERRENIHKYEILFVIAEGPHP